jgi:hypothetical protein
MLNELFSYRFPQEPFCPVPCYCGTDFFTDGETQPAEIESIRERIYNKMFRRKFTPEIKSFFEIPFFIQRIKKLFPGYTASLFRPFFLLLLIMARPPAELILSRKPWVLFFLILCG